ncbi:hypothetical protein H0H81_005040 [Sphagnurus paluster]|uniref:Uncharacterized protein n=1 Tax=Sphagnurus paluster TaxID=117069 RepID=A0A9P7FYA6_9AGAR|nr:hypothetical protein H0H81_005040 [Sphagnurus paluster]
MAVSASCTAIPRKRCDQAVPPPPSPRSPEELERILQLGLPAPPATPHPAWFRSPRYRLALLHTSRRPTRIAHTPISLTTRDSVTVLAHILHA